jgi:murein DD-endopeptidase MepM/ murein hydrolase activator NlpD
MNYQKISRPVQLSICLIVIATLFWVVPVLRVFPLGILLLFRSGPTQLSVPVEGVSPSQLVDTWGGPRSGGRHHKGIDIFGKRGQNIRSTTDGVVVFVGELSLGGRTVWVLGPGGKWHYYAHLEKYGNVRPGQWIRAGHLVGMVGDSGNAKGTPPHLHYGIYLLFGRAINPYPLLHPQNT